MFADVSIGSTVRTWGSTPEERAAAYPCDRLLSDGYRLLFRAVDVSAPAPLVWRWLCQIRAAPYSYDLLDNFGRRSPRHLTPGLERLELGQQFMIFRLASFEPDRSITLTARSWMFGDLALTYAAIPADATRCRLVAKLGVSPRATPVVGPMLDRLLDAGDLVMMRKQLLTLKRLAERDARVESLA
jgi:hypothetical protein